MKVRLLIFSAPELKPLKGFPEGKYRIVLREGEFGRVYIKTKEGIRAFYLADSGEFITPGPEIERNERGGKYPKESYHPLFGMLQSGPPLVREHSEILLWTGKCWCLGNIRRAKECDGGSLYLDDGTGRKVEIEDHYGWILMPSNRKE